MSTLRIMSNNIWKCDKNYAAWEAQGEDCSAPTRAKGFARVYTESKPDILGIQECSPLMAECIMDHMKQDGAPYALLWGRDTPILYRYDRLELVDCGYCNYPENVPGYEGSFNNQKTKSYSTAVFRIKENGRLLIFATTHLWWKLSDPAAGGSYQAYSDEARVFQLNQLLDHVKDLKAQYNCPVVVVGDMNTVYTSPAVQSALGRGYVHGYDVAVEYRDETNGHHYCYADGYDHYENPKDFQASIDHILLEGCPEGAVRRFQRYAPDWYMPLSDHFPVWIDVDLTV